MLSATVITIKVNYVSFILLEDEQNLNMKVFVLGTKSVQLSITHT